MRLPFLSVLLGFIASCGMSAVPSSNNALPAANNPKHFALTWNGGGFEMDIYVAGKPYGVLVDTGSSNLILVGDQNVCPAVLCSQDLTNDQLFSPLAGLKPTSGPYSITYGIGGGSLDLYQESVSLTSTGPSIQYDVGVFTAGDHLSNILGLAYDTLVQGPESYVSFWSQYRSTQGIQDVFAINLCPYQGENSFIQFGGIESSVSVNYTKILPLPLKNGESDYLFYAVQPKRLWIDDETSVLFPTLQQRPGFYTIVDSGTTQIVLSPSMVYALKSYYAASGIPDAFWNNSPGSGSSTEITAAQFAQLKPLSVEFPSYAGSSTFKVQISPQTYTFSTPQGTYVSAIASSTDLGGSGPQAIILGNMFMQNTYVVFDRFGSSIGFADNRALCEQP